MSKVFFGTEVPGVLSAHTQEKYGSPPSNYQRFLELLHSGDLGRVVVTSGVDLIAYDSGSDGKRNALLTTRQSLTASGSFSHIVARVIFY